MNGGNFSKIVNPLHELHLICPRGNSRSVLEIVNFLFLFEAKKDRNHVRELFVGGVCLRHRM